MTKVSNQKPNLSITDIVGKKVKDCSITPHGKLQIIFSDGVGITVRADAVFGFDWTDKAQWNGNYLQEVADGEY